MPKGSIDMLPEMATNVSAWLPRGIVEVVRAEYGGAIRMHIQGEAIEEGANYQLVVTDDPLKRTVELRRNA